jgi:hypothetical protein
VSAEYERARHDHSRGSGTSYLALLALAGPRALAECIFGIKLDADVFSTWVATGRDLKSVLQVDGRHIVCQELRAQFPPRRR